MSDPGNSSEQPPSANALLRDYERKRGRAAQHLNTLRESVERFTNVKRKPVRGEFDRDSGRAYVFRVSLEPVDPDWVLMLGDFAHNLRSALNYLVTALVRSTGNQEDNRNEFQIYGIEQRHWTTIDQWWENDPEGQIRRKLNNTPPDTKAALKRLQPFYDFGRATRLTPPAHLQELNNADKHRRLNLVAQGVFVRFRDAEGKRIYEGPDPRSRVPVNREGDEYVVRLEREERGDVYLLPAYDVRLHEPPFLIGNLIETLDGIGQYIDAQVLPTVRSLLPP